MAKNKTQLEVFLVSFTTSVGLSILNYYSKF